MFSIMKKWEKSFKDLQTLHDEKTKEKDDEIADLKKQLAAATAGGAGNANNVLNSLGKPSSSPSDSGAGGSGAARRNSLTPAQYEYVPDPKWTNLGEGIDEYKRLK